MKIKKTIFPLLLSLFLFSISTNLNTLGPLTNVDATGRFYYYDVDTDTIIPTTPSNLTVTGYTDNFDDGESLDFSTWAFEVLVSEGVSFTEYFNGNSGDFGDYFSVNVLRNGVLTTISNLEPLYYVDTKITVSFNDGSNPLEFTFNIVVNTIDPFFTKYDLPDDSLELEVATNGHDYFNEGDTITFSNWSFSVTLMSGTQVFMNHDDVYLTIYDPGTLDESVFDVFVEFQVFDIYMSSYVGIYVEPYVEYIPDYSLSIVTLPDQLVYFFDDAIDFSNLLIELYDYGDFIETLDSSSAGISFTNAYGDEIIEFDFLSLDDTEIFVYYDDGMGFGASTFFSITIHSSSYRYDFTSSIVSPGTVSESLPIEVSFGDINDVWIVSGESTDAENPAVQTASNNDNFGLTFGDSFSGNYPESISLMSKHLWGVYGSAGQDVGYPTSGKPIIQNVYVKAFTSLGGSADLSIKINNVLLYTHEINDVEPSKDWWYTFAFPPQIGHIEFVINVDSAVPAVVFLQEIAIDSNNGHDSYPSLSPMLKFASDMESLDTCLNQEEFLETNQSLYLTYLNASDIDGIFENLLLLDHKTTGDAKSQLVVTTVNKWNMMVTQYANTDGISPLLASNRGIDNNITMHYVFGTLFILIQLFWIGRRFSFFDKEIKQ
jgi:hypothetical protein